MSKRKGVKENVHVMYLRITPPEAVTSSECINSLTAIYSSLRINVDCKERYVALFSYIERLVRFSLTGVCFGRQVFYHNFLPGNFRNTFGHNDTIH